MLKRKAKQFISMLTSLALAATFVLSTAAPASATNNIPLGDSGYVSLHTYTTPTDVENVYKVKLSMDVNTQLEPADIVFVIDNSGSMGLPAEDEYLDPATGTPVTLNQTLVDWSSTHPVAGIPSATPSVFKTMTDTGTFMNLDYNWEDTIDPGDIGTNFDLFTMGAWSRGAELDQQYYQNSSITSSLRYANPYNSPALNGQGYRFEWMKEGLMEAVELLLDPSKSGTAELNQVSVFAFGDGSTETDGADNNLKMQALLPAGTLWDAYDPAAYNWDLPTTATSAGHVWANNYHLNGDLFNIQSPFTTTDYITFNSNFVTGSFANTDTPTNDSWVTKDNFQQLLTEIDQKLVRREEGTGTASGLQAAYEIFTNPMVTKTRPNANKYVFLLTDGLELTNRHAQPAPMAPANLTFTESLSVAARLKELGVNMTGLGILDNDSSLFVGDRFDASRHANITTQNPQPTDLIDYIGQAPQVDPGTLDDGYAGEQHLLRILTPLKKGSPYLDPATNIQGSAFMVGFTTDSDLSVVTGSGYGDYVNDITTGGQGDISQLSYYRANTKQGVIDAFREFVKSIYAASDIVPEITLGSAFTVYQMPGKPLFETVNSSASGGNRSISWTISDVPATGGTASVTFYVKVDPTASGENLWQGLFDSFIIKYKDFLANATKKGMPQSYIEVPSTAQAQEIDHRLDDSGIAVYTSRKTAEPAFVNSFAAKVNVSVADVSATSPGKGKARLVIDTSAAVNGSETLYYQWQRFDKAKEEWVSIQGANSSVFTVTGLAKGEYTFRCAVRTVNSAFTFSKEVTVTVK